MADLAVTPTTFIPKKVDAAQLPAVANIAALYTTPAGTATKIVSVILVNDTTTPVTATLQINPNGGAAAADDTIILCKGLSVPSDGAPIYLLVKDQYLNATDTIEGYASAADQVTYHISIVEESA